MEHVLGTPTARFREAGSFQGFRSFDAGLFAFLLDPAHLEYRPRPDAENDPTFKQLIPYAVLRFGDQLFHYRRGQLGGEARLRALRSVGVGGHISLAEDAQSADPYRAGMLRELNEEIEIRAKYREQILGLINDDSTPVGSVHLGVVHLLELDAPAVAPRESGLMDAGFAPITQLAADAGRFETWSQFVLQALGTR
jgi:predicted NUDIX family phosphoesterase